MRKNLFLHQKMFKTMKNAIFGLKLYLFFPVSGHSATTVSKAYESLKSHGSTGSTGSKTSTGSSSVMLELDEENVPNTEDPELLNHLNFVSPKAGVYRPVSTGSSGNNSKCSNKDKEKCSIM